MNFAPTDSPRGYRSPASIEPPLERLRQLYGFMAPRWFVASRAELVDAGFAGERIDNWLRGGRLLKVLRGVYSYGRDIESRQALWRAALLKVGEGSLLSGRSACEAWGIVRAASPLPRSVKVDSPSGRTRQLRGLSPVLARTRIEVAKRQIGPDEKRKRNGLDLESPGLSLLTFAATATQREVRFAFLEACRLSLFARGDVADCYRRMAGRRGAKKLRPLLALWVPELARTRSVLEGLFLLAWVERGLPVPWVNEKAYGYELDAYWPDSGVVLELDGAAFHRGAIQRSIDAAKQRALEVEGLVVLRITYQEFMADPAAAIATVARVLGLI